MIGILLFLLLFYLLCNTVFSQEPGEVQMDMLIDLEGIFDILLEVFTGFLTEYYYLLIGFFLVYAFWSYIQGILEGKKERLRREQAERAVQENRLQMDKRAEEKRLSRERELIRKYIHASDDEIERIQWAMRQEVKGDDGDLRLAPRDFDDLPVDRDVFRYSGKVDMIEYNDGLDREIYEYGGRGTTYFRVNGSQEGSESLFDDTVTIGESSTVIIRNNKRSRFRRGMEDEDEGGGY
jgi:hypothetical protein